jgi:sulfur carrier protein
MTPVAATLRVHVNDTARTVPQGARLLSLLDEMALGGRLGLAVALNAAVVPRAHWADQKLQEGDRILIIQASQGG